MSDVLTFQPGDFVRVPDGLKKVKRYGIVETTIAEGVVVRVGGHRTLFRPEDLTLLCSPEATDA